MMSTELSTTGADVTVAFDRSALDALGDFSDSVAVESFIERCSVEVTDALAAKRGADSRYIAYAASATFAAVESGLIPAAGRASDEQLSNQAWAERLTGDPAYPSNEVSRWRNAAKALKLGMDPGTPEFGVVTQTPRGITQALDEAIKTLGKGKTDTKRAETIRRGVVKAVTSGDNGGNGSREVHDIRKLSVQDIFAHLTDVLKSASEAHAAAETDEARKAALDVIGDIGKRAQALYDAAHDTASDVAAAVAA